MTTLPDQILALLRSGPMTRCEIAGRLGCTTKSVRPVVAALVRQGLVVQVERRHTPVRLSARGLMALRKSNEHTR